MSEVDVMTLSFSNGEVREYTKESFNKLKATGMLWEFHPDAPMFFEADEKLD